VQDHRETDVADRFRHLLADPLPALARALEPVDPAVVLVIEDVGLDRGDAQAVHVVAVLRVGIGQEVGGDALVERLPARAAVGRFEDAARRHADVQMLRVARVDVDRVQRGAVRRRFLQPAHPRRAHRIRVEAVDTLPGVAAVRRTEEALRRRAGVPHARLGCVSRRQPEDVRDDEAGLAGGRLRERRRTGRLLPGAPAIGGAEHRRTEMPGARGDEERPPVARIEHRVVHDVAEEVRRREPPGPPAGVGREDEQALARADEDAGRAGLLRPLLGHRRLARGYFTPRAR
jgi:hypothetical protein